MLFSDVLRFAVICATFINVVKMAPDIECSKCSGVYCGRKYKSNSSDDCQAPCLGCSRGYRSNGYFCMKCTENLHLYDWLFLGFMALSVTVLNFFAIDVYHASHRHVWILHLSALLESIMSFILSILCFEPFGKMKLSTCSVSSIQDWYTVFFNPKVDYKTTIHCTQEAVYPLFTFVLINLVISLVFMIICRGIVLRILRRRIGLESLYIGFYIIPIVATIHTCLGGVIYYTFPYLTCVFSAVGVAVFLSAHRNDYFRIFSIKRPRHFGILVCYMIAHGYGIVSITEMKLIERDLPVLLLVFLPFSFYTLTRPFTNARNFVTL